MTTIETHRPASDRAPRGQWSAGLRTLLAPSGGPQRGPMKRFLLVAAATASVLPLGMSPAVANQPAMHFTQPVAGSDPLQCGETTYTPVSGELAIVVHDGQSASGNTNFPTTITPRHVVLQDQDGNLYSLAGTIWFGETSNATTGGSQGTSTDKFQIVSRGGGTVDSVNGVEHISPNGKEFLFNFGTCG